MQSTKEDQILLAGIEDKMDRCSEQFMVTNSGFLDLRQRTMVERLCRTRGGVQYGFIGGYPDAERTVAVFFPDYVDAATPERQEAWLTENPEDHPLALLRVSHNGSRELTHRDYLGSLTGLGIKREMVGDILVRPEGCDLIVMKEISEFLQYHYDQAGRVSLKAELLPLSQLIVPEGRREEKKDTVASLRLDNVIASAFSLSRTKAAEAISSGLVFVNSLQQTKPDRIVEEGDKLVLRGKGKAILKEVGGATRKDRIFILIEKYL